MAERLNGGRAEKHYRVERLVPIEGRKPAWFSSGEFTSLEAARRRLREVKKTCAALGYETRLVRTVSYSEVIK